MANEDSKTLVKIERHLNQITWLLLLVWISLVTTAIVVASVAKG